MKLYDFNFFPKQIISVHSAGVLECLSDPLSIASKVVELRLFTGAYLHTKTVRYLHVHHEH